MAKEQCKAEREEWYNCEARRWDPNKEGPLRYLGGRRDNEPERGKIPITSDSAPPRLGDLIAPAMALRQPTRSSL